MRLITWNCCRKFEEKSSVLCEEKPDIAVVQECSESSLQRLPPGYTGVWLGGGRDQGLGLIHTEPFVIKSVTPADEASFALVEIGGPISFFLVAAWNCRPKGTTYLAHLHKFLQSHEEWFRHENVILAGDLNSQTSASFDKGAWRHEHFAEDLSRLGLQDAYGTLNAESASRQATYRHRRSQDHLFHLDYIFASKAMLDRITRVDVCSAEVWAKLSDHSPVSAVLSF